MRRRVMMGKRELVEVVEELKSSGTWLVAVALVHRQALKEVVEGAVGYPD